MKFIRLILLSGMLKLAFLIILASPLVHSGNIPSLLKGFGILTHASTECVKSTTGDEDPDDEFNDFVVDIPDPMLEYLLRRNLMKPYGPIMRSDLEGLTQLEYFWESGVDDYDGFQYCTGLTGFGFLYDNFDSEDLEIIGQMTWLESFSVTGGYDLSGIDFSPLANLTKLRHIQFVNCNGTLDLNPFRNLENLESFTLLGCDRLEIIGTIPNPLSLQSVVLRGTTISEFDFSDGFENLKFLQVYNDRIISLNGLSSLTNLEELAIGSDEVVGIDEIGDIPNLKSLNVSISSGWDLSILENCTNLRELNTGWLTDEMDPDHLASLTGLEVLKIGGSGISLIWFIQNLVNLRELQLVSRQVTYITPLANLHNLEILGLSVSPGTDFNILAGLTSLTELRLENNHISDPTPIASLTNLEVLNLRNCGITSLEFLENLTDLRELILDGCSSQGLNLLCEYCEDSGSEGKITDISPLAGLVNLTKLSLVEQAITDLSPLSNLVNLESLDLKRNSITDLSPLKMLPNLTCIVFSCNQVTDFDGIVDNPHLGCNTTIRFDDNPLSESAMETQLIQLIERGIIRDYDYERHWDDFVVPDPGLERALGYIYNGCCLARVTIWDLRCLKSFSAPGFRISSLELMENCINLENLDLSSNYISDISQLAGLPNLVNIDLSSNLITDLTPLVNNPGINEGDVLNLEYNPLSNTALEVQIPKLLTRGVHVFY